MSGVGAQLRAARERRGWSLDDLSSRTRIPAHHLEAIEADRLDDLPARPHRTAWVRDLCELLEVEPDGVSVEAPPPAPSPVSLSVARVTGLVAVFVALALITLVQVGDPRRSASTSATPARALDQRVEITARRNVRVEVRVDGEEVFEGLLSGGEARSFEAHSRVQIDVGAVDAVQIRYNGDTIVPQGRQDAPRRLVFIDDVGS